jgi:RNA-binding protein YlmH
VAVNELTIKWHLDGGFKEAERKRLVVFPSWKVETEAKIAYIRIVPKDFQEQAIGHRDYLGAVLNLGLKRGKLGDIVVEDPGAILIVDSSIADFICQQLTRIKHSAVSAEVIPSDRFVFQAPILSVVQLSLASLRLDAAIAGAFNLSRSEVDSLIEAGNASINHMEVYKGPAVVKAGDLISVRGLGRFRLEEIGGISRKGRQHVKISRW